MVIDDDFPESFRMFWCLIFRWGQRGAGRLTQVRLQVADPNEKTQNNETRSSAKTGNFKDQEAKFLLWKMKTIRLRQEIPCFCPEVHSFGFRLKQTESSPAENVQVSIQTLLLFLSASSCRLVARLWLLPPIIFCHLCVCVWGGYAACMDMSLNWRSRNAGDSVTYWPRAFDILCKGQSEEELKSCSNWRRRSHHSPTLTYQSP